MIPLGQGGSQKIDICRDGSKYRFSYPIHKCVADMSNSIETAIAIFGTIAIAIAIAKAIFQLLLLILILIRGCPEMTSLGLTK